MTIHARPRADLHADMEPNAILLTALLAEVRAAASEAEERGFLFAVGRRIARTFPLTGLVELEALADGMNRIWRMLDLGHVRLSIDATGVAIEHGGFPQAGGAADPAILEGIYAGWFDALGSDRLALNRIGSSDGKIRFHYGR